jgi:hypothetical protein
MVVQISRSLMIDPTITGTIKTGIDHRDMGPANPPDGVGHRTSTRNRVKKQATATSGVRL